MLSGCLNKFDFFSFNIEAVPVLWAVQSSHKSGLEIGACLGEKNIGKPCAGKPHARFDEGGQARACSLLYPITCELLLNRGLIPDLNYYTKTNCFKNFPAGRFLAGGRICFGRKKCQSFMKSGGMAAAVRER